MIHGSDHSPGSESELIEAFDWNEARGLGLGAEFLRSVEASFSRILRHPESYPVIHRGTRMAAVHRFPFLVLYRLRKAEIIVVAIFHAKRDPQPWKPR